MACQSQRRQTGPQGRPTLVMLTIYLYLQNHPRHFPRYQLPWSMKGRQLWYSMLEVHLMPARWSGQRPLLKAELEARGKTKFLNFKIFLSKNHFFILTAQCKPRGTCVMPTVGNLLLSKNSRHTTVAAMIMVAAVPAVCPGYVSPIWVNLEESADTNCLPKRDCPHHQRVLS